MKSKYQLHEEVYILVGHKIIKHIIMGIVFPELYGPVDCKFTVRGSSTEKDIEYYVVKSINQYDQSYSIGAIKKMDKYREFFLFETKENLIKAL